MMLCIHCAAAMFTNTENPNGLTKLLESTAVHDVTDAIVSSIHTQCTGVCVCVYSQRKSDSSSGWS